MSYAYTYLKHKTITDIIIFMHSYNELIQLLMLIRISHWNTYLYLSPVGHILIHISSYARLSLYIYLYGGTYSYTHTSISLILVQISHRSYRAYAYTEVPLGTTRLILIP